MSFSVWLTLGQIVNTINFRLDQLLIGTFVSKIQLGYYVVGDNLATIPTREATAPLTATVFPAFSRLAHDRPRLAAAYSRAQSLTTAVALPLGAGVAIIADPLVRLTMGHKWIPAIFIIQALAAVFAFQTLGNLAQPLAMATGQTPLLFKRSLQALLFRVPFILIGMYADGMIGIVYARIFTGTAGLFMNANIVTRITGLTFMQQIGSNFRALASSAAMALAAAGLWRFLPAASNSILNIEEIALLIPFCAAIYVFFTAALWHLAGRPSGPETELLSLVAKAAGNIRSKLRPAPAADPLGK
jgi:O-antigen/teichoic acid export membrane protein